MHLDGKQDAGKAFPPKKLAHVARCIYFKVEAEREANWIQQAPPTKPNH